MLFSNLNLAALGVLLVMLLLSLVWVFGAPKARKARSHDVVRGRQRADGTWDRAATRSRDAR